MTDRKKSTFVAKTTAASADTFDFVSSNTNFKITKADLVADLGVTGTIVQDGAVTGTPVLDTQGSVNNIRNLENGSGVKAQVSPENGITLDHNFTVDATGVAILGSPTLTSPIMRSIKAGAGIAVSLDGDSIAIAASGVVASTKTITVFEKADFGTVVSGVITLVADTNYLVVNDIEMGTDRLLLQNNTSILGSGVLTVAITYTGTGALFSWVNSTAAIYNLMITTTNGSVWSGSNVSEVIRIQDLLIPSCDSLGTFTSSTATSIRLTNVAIVSAISNGITFSGTFNGFGQQAGFTNLLAGTMYALGTAVFSSFSLDTTTVVVSSGATGLSGATNSANIAADRIANVRFGSISGAGTTITGVTIDDKRWAFMGNSGFPDTHTHGLLTLQNNATETVITTSSTDGSNAVLVAGTWVVTDVSQTTGNTAGRLTMDLEHEQSIPVMASISVEPASGTSIGVSIYLAVDGTVVAASRRATTASAGSPTSVTLPWTVDFAEGQFVEMFVENNDNTTNILVSSAVLRLG